MRFRLLDRIEDLVPGARITAVKQLRADEEYLQDHFPRFPVMPGVLMLEALFQAGMWLVRSADDFRDSAVLLKEARNVKYTDFVEPGEVLTVTAELMKQDETTATIKAEGRVDGGMAVSARLLLERFDASERFPHLAGVDPYARQRMRQEFARLYPPANRSGSPA